MFCTSPAAEEEEARKAAFAATRAAHYNMAAALRGHVSFEDEESDEDKQQDANCEDDAEDGMQDTADGSDAMTRKEKFAQKRKVGARKGSAA